MGKVKNSFWLGLALGLVFPAIAFLLDRCTDWMSGLAPEKEAWPYMAAAGANLLLVRLCYKGGTAPLERTAKGVIWVTFVVAICVLRFLDMR